MNKIDDIRHAFVSKYKNKEFVPDRTGAKTIELIASTFQCNDEKIFGNINDSWNRREINWYKSRSLNINDIQGEIPTLWVKTANEDGEINSNYGWCVWDGKNGSQYKNVIKAFEQDINTRRAIMIYTRPSMHNDAFASGKNDFICTNAVQYLIRDFQLIGIVQMRSNDAVFGYRGDYAWQKQLHQELLLDLNEALVGYGVKNEIKPGPIYWHVGSLHMYERHFHMIDMWDKWRMHIDPSACSALETLNESR